MSQDKSTEEVKRLQPKSEVLRELFLKSGNLCAFPECSRLIMNQEGVFVGQICHIEAAEEGGERFNKDQTNEDRRAFGNLMLMCYEHHQVTNDVDKFPVKRMQEMKAAHERKVSEFIEKTLLNVSDQTKLNTPRPAKTCARMRRILKWNLNDEELATTTVTINELLARLSKIPRPALQLLVVIVERAKAISMDHELVLVAEVQLACNLNDSTMSQLCHILDNYRLIEAGEPDDYGNNRICLRDFDGWDVWADFRAFAATGNATLQELIVDINFSLLDEPIKPATQPLP